MKVSILITSYNCQDSIDAAVQSVIEQEMPFDWELLVGDDGSSDNTQRIIKEWVNRFPNNIKLFVMPRNSSDSKNGTRAARNRANLLTHASGEYITFLDGDDLFIGNQKIQRQIELLDSEELSDCSGIAHNILANDVVAEKKYPMVSESISEGKVDSKYYWKNLYFHTNTIVFRRKCVELMLDDRYKDFLNDNFITYIILQYGYLYYIPKIWAQYNLTGNGLWTGKKRTYGCFRNLILFDLERSINKDFIYSSLVRHLYDFRYIFKNYDIQDRESVHLLLKDIDEIQFPYTFLLYKIGSELSLKDRVKKSLLQCEISALMISRWAKRLPIYVNRMMKGAQKQ